MEKILSFLSIAFLLFSTMPVVSSAYENQAALRFRNMRTLSVTETQMDSLKAHQGISFYEEFPAGISEEYFIVVVPESLGSGYIAGTAADIASGLNAAGITLGLDEAAVSGTRGIIAGGAASTVLGIVLALATGTSKPLSTQRFNFRSYNQGEGNIVAQEGVLAEQTGVPGVNRRSMFHPAETHTPASHHAATHHPQGDVSQPTSESDDSERPSRRSMFHPAETHTPASHHAATHHPQGGGAVINSEIGASERPSRRSMFHPAETHTPASHHAATHH